MKSDIACILMSVFASTGGAWLGYSWPLRGLGSMGSAALVGIANFFTAWMLCALVRIAKDERM